MVCRLSSVMKAVEIICKVWKVWNSSNFDRSGRLMQDECSRNEVCFQKSVCEVGKIVKVFKKKLDRNRKVEIVPQSPGLEGGVV